MKKTAVTNREEMFRSMPVSKAMWTLCLPNILSMLTGVLYNLVDMYFIGKIGDPNQVAAVSLCGPLFMALMGFGNVFGIGGGAYLARSMGEGAHERVKKISSFCFWTALGIGVISGVLILSFIDPLMKVFGTSKNTVKFAHDYTLVSGISAPIMVLNYVLSNLVRSEGGAKETMIGQMMGTVINIILDPIMIFVFNMGVVGAAIATVIGNLCANIYFALYVIFKSKTQSIAPKLYNASWKNMALPILVVGVPASLSNIMTSFANLILNNKLVAYGDVVIAGLGVSMKVYSICMMVLIAIAFGIQPLMAYNYGARNQARFKEALRYTAIVQIIFGTGAGLLIEIFAGPLVRFFMDNPDVVRYGRYILRVNCASAPFLGVLYLLTNLFQSMGKGLPSLIVSLSRQGLVYIPVLLVMSLMGLYGALWAQPAADLISFIMAIVIYLMVTKKDKNWNQTSLEA